MLFSITSGHGGLHGSGSFSPRSPLVEVHYSSVGLSPMYMFQLVIVLRIFLTYLQVYSVTATDCNGCSVTSSFTVNLSSVPGCTDPLASNYCYLNVDDGSVIILDVQIL